MAIANADDESVLPKGTRSIEDYCLDLARGVPDESWAQLPEDLSENHDFYLYAVPKSTF